MLWFTEAQTDCLALSLKVKDARRIRSKFQDILLLDTYEFGRVLVLDGAIQTTQRDEFIYHEMIAHVPLFSLGRRVGNVLVVGGGDGGTVREVLKHSPDSVDLVEIDSAVVDLCREFLPEISCCLDDERVCIHFEDGREFVRNSDRMYDAVIVDCSDPDGPSESLFEKNFYEDVYRVLKPGGVFVTQSESPFLHLDFIKSVYEYMRNVFSNVYLYTAFIPSYPSGMWSFMLASDVVNPLLVDRDLLSNSIRKVELEHGRMRYYNEAVHFSSFSLPQFLREEVKGEG